MWILKLSRIYGMEVPDSIRSEDIRLKGLLEKHCRGPYDEDGIQMGLGIHLEGGGVPVKQSGVKLDPFGNGILSAGVYAKRCDWDVPLPSYRRFLWQNVDKAIWGCVEKLKKKKIAFDADKLRQHLSLVEAEFLGEAAKSAEPDAAPKTEPMPVDVYPEDELYPVVIQYRVEGHGTMQDHDRRVKIETLLEEFLGETDLGYLDGGDIGSGTANIFCFLKPGRKGTEAIIQTLRKNGYLDGAVIQETVKGKEKVVWPPDYAGEFSVV